MFPELSLTGYDLGASAVAVDDPALAAVVEACGTMNTIALVGAPTSDGTGSGRAISVVVIDAAGARVVYRKQHLGSEEAEHFTPGPRPVVLDLDGWRIGLGVCRDTGVADHVKELANAGIDLYVAGLVDHPDDLGVQRERAATIATTCRAYVGFASFAGPTAGGYDETAGPVGDLRSRRQPSSPRPRRCRAGSPGRCWSEPRPVYNVSARLEP